MASISTCLRNILYQGSINLFPTKKFLQCTPGAFVQTRGSRYKRRTTYRFSWLQQRKHKYYDEELTSENKIFLKEHVKQEFTVKPISESSPLKEPPWPKGEWTPESKRCGVIARKIGIYPMWDKNGKRLLTTVLQVLDNHVINYIPPEEFALQRFGAKYKGELGALIVGADAADPQLFTSAYNGLFTKAGVQTKRKLTRFIVTPDAALQPGTPLFATHFRVGDYVDIWGKTVGHGFQGVMKRWGFKGGPASHGCTKSHRRPGNVGGGRDASRVWPGKKLPGHMGQERRILRGLKIWRINTKYNVIYVHGPAVPGHVHAYVYIMDSCTSEKKHKEAPAFPTFFLDDIKEPLPEEYYDKELHVFSDPTIIFPEEKETKVSKTALKIRKR